MARSRHFFHFRANEGQWHAPCRPTARDALPDGVQRGIAMKKKATPSLLHMQQRRVQKTNHLLSKCRQ
eukprot:10754279-Prorocentrum_lima.AAC.1